MNVFRPVCVALAIALISWNHPVSAKDDVVTGFNLRTTSGKTAVLDAEPPSEVKFTVVCFIGIECPLARLYGPRLNELAQEFKTHGVRFIGVDSNRQDSEEELTAFVESLNLQFPVAKDHRNLVADQFQAERTPEIFVVDRDLNIVYRGRVDDQYQPGIAKSKPTRNDLRIAIEELLTGELPSQPLTKPEGCIIGRVKETREDSPITFSKQISRVLQRHCAECHRAGDIGPFSLTDYEEVVGWGDMIVEVVDEGRMPPWHADPNHGDFANTRLMPSLDKQILRDWVAAGAPFGKADELPELLKRKEGWNLPRDPDVVVSMSDKPFDVPADGTVDYQYFVVDPGFKEDKWVVAAEVAPGNRSVVHHSIVFIRPPDGVSYTGVGWLSAYVPGQRETAYPDRHGRRVPAGSKLVFQQHYTPVGKKQSDITKIGLVFADESEIDQKVYTLIAIDQDFEIPPHAGAYRVEAKVRYLPKKGELLGFAPHMHYRGKSFRVTSRSGESENIMLDVPNYDFNWQHTYKLKEPIPLESLDEINFTATFDNSADNPANPDPDQTVYWGDQTYEEMAVAFFEIAETRIEPENFEVTTPAQVLFSANEQKKCEQFVDDFFARFDKNNDGLVSKKEVPLAMRRFAFTNWDEGGDDVLRRDEVFMAVEWDFRLSEELAAERSRN